MSSRSFKEMAGWPLRRALNPRVEWIIQAMDARLGSDNGARPPVHHRIDGVSGDMEVLKAEVEALQTETAALSVRMGHVAAEVANERRAVDESLAAILERLRQAQGQGSGKPSLSRRIQQAGLSRGQQPGQPQNGQQPGNTGAGTGPMAPQRPDLDEILANRKDIWGDLPPQLREEMDNIFREEMLPAKRELIMRYFSSVAEQGQAGGEP